MVGCCHKAVVCGGTRRGDGVVGAHETKIHCHQRTSPATGTLCVIQAHDTKIQAHESKIQAHDKKTHGHEYTSFATVT